MKNILLNLSQAGVLTIALLLTQASFAKADTATQSVQITCRDIDGITRLDGKLTVPAGTFGSAQDPNLSFSKKNFTAKRFSAATRLSYGDQVLTESRFEAQRINESKSITGWDFVLWLKGSSGTTQVRLNNIFQNGGSEIVSLIQVGLKNEDSMRTISGEVDNFLPEPNQDDSLNKGYKVLCELN